MMERKDLTAASHVRIAAAIYTNANFNVTNFNPHVRRCISEGANKVLDNGGEMD
jgi:hypothetical protein